VNAVINNESITISDNHIHDDRYVTYTYSNADGNFSINERLENEIQEINIPFNDLIIVFQIIMANQIKLNSFN